MTTSKMDDSTTVVLSLPAESEISGWPAVKNRPSLILRCRERKTEAYITTGMAANVEYGHPDEAKVTLRFDQSPAKNVWANESTDNAAVFLPSAVGQIRTMAKSERMLFRFTPFNSSPQETEFDLRGLSVVLPDLTQACRWDVKTQASTQSATTKAASQETTERGGYGVGGFSIQVGAHKDRASAEALAAQLQGKGFTTYIVDPPTVGEGLFNVRVGVFQTRAEAESFQARLRTEENLKPFIVREQP